MSNSTHSTRLAISEQPFKALNFEPDYTHDEDCEIAYRTKNEHEKWYIPEQILSLAKANVNHKYTHKGYEFAYWIYKGNIYRTPRLMPVQVFWEEICNDNEKLLSRQLQKIVRLSWKREKQILEVNFNATC